MFEYEADYEAAHGKTVKIALMFPDFASAEYSIDMEDYQPYPDAGFAATVAEGSNIRIRVYSGNPEEPDNESIYTINISESEE